MIEMPTQLPPPTSSETTLPRRLLFALLLGVVLALFAGFGSQHLTQFVTADEHYWFYERIPQYWNALADHKWKKTFINDKPGVSVALVSGAGLLVIPHPEAHVIENTQGLDRYHVEQTERLYAVFRIPLLVFTAGALAYLFWIVRIVTRNYWIALWTVTGTALSPILIGISQIVNPDALVWSSVTAALLTYCAVLQYPQKKRFVVLTAAWFGFALLSKYSTVILFPMFLFFFLWRTFLSGDNTDDENSEAFASLLRRHVINYGAICLGAIFFCMLFLPAVVVKPEKLVELLSSFSRVAPIMYVTVIGILLSIFVAASWRVCVPYLSAFRRWGMRIKPWLETVLLLTMAAAFLTLILGRNFFSEWALFERIPFDVKDASKFSAIGYMPNIAEIFFLNLNPFAFSLVPLVLLLMFAEWFRLAFRPFYAVQKPDTGEYVTVVLTLFMPIFLIANALSETVVTIRYSILLYPLAAFIAARGLTAITSGLAATTGRKLVVSMLFMGLLSVSVWSSSPFFFNYTSFLLPRDQIVTDAWGYGGYEAAQYINSLPDADTLTVWSDYYGVCEFIRGRCITSYHYTSGEYPIDYYVLTRRGRIRYGPERDDRRRITTVRPYAYYDRSDPVWRLDIGGRPENFIRIHRSEDEAFRVCGGPEKVCVGIVTDIAACGTDPGNYNFLEPRLAAAIKSFNERYTAFNVSLGDNANYGLRRCNESGRDDVLWVRDRFALSQAPFHFVLGDRDVLNNTATDVLWHELIGREQAYYSFDVKDVHVVILDTVLGGDRMRETCENDPICSEALQSKETLSALLKDSSALANYLAEQAVTKAEVIVKKNQFSRLVEEAEENIKNTRSPARRDRGQVGQAQLDWLAEDLKTTDKRRVLVLSDHPLFRFQSPRKLYDIIGREAVQKILWESGKEVVAISGEAHVWHEEIQATIHYYIVDEFVRGDGAWAMFRWASDGAQLIRFVDGQEVPDTGGESDFQ